jgi:hypothetical protein
VNRICWFMGRRVEDIQPSLQNFNVTFIFIFIFYTNTKKRQNTKEWVGESQ